jgi:hypothetical protein
MQRAPFDETMPRMTSAGGSYSSERGMFGSGDTVGAAGAFGRFIGFLQPFSRE